MSGRGWLLLILTCVPTATPACSNFEATTINANSFNETITLSCFYTQPVPPVLKDYYWEYKSVFHLASQDGNCVETKYSSSCVVTEELVNGVTVMKLTHTVEEGPDLVRSCVQQCNITVTVPHMSETEHTMTSNAVIMMSTSLTSIAVTAPSSSTANVSPTTSHLTTHSSTSTPTTAAQTVATTVTTTVSVPPTSNTTTVIAVVSIVVSTIVLALVVLMVIAVYMWMRRRRYPIHGQDGTDLEEINNDDGFLVSAEAQNFCNDDDGAKDTTSFQHKWDLFLIRARKMPSLLKVGSNKNSRSSLLTKDDHEDMIETQSSNVRSSNASILQREDNVIRINPLARGHHSTHALKQAHPLEITHTASSDSIVKYTSNTM